MQDEIVRSIVGHFENQSELGRLLGWTPPSTVNDWVRKNRMPKSRRIHVLRLINEIGIEIPPEQQAYLQGNDPTPTGTNSTPSQGFTND